MKVPLFLLLFGAMMLGLSFPHTSLMKRRAVQLTGQEALNAARMRRIVLTQTSVITAIAWLAAGALYLSGTQIPFEVWRKWFSGASVLLMGCFAVGSYAFITLKIRRLDPADTEAAKSLIAVRFKIAALFGFLTVMTLLSFFRR